MVRLVNMFATEGRLLLAFSSKHTKKFSIQTCYYFPTWLRYIEINDVMYKHSSLFPFFFFVEKYHL